MKIQSIATGILSATLLCGPAAAADTYYDAGKQALPLQQSGGTARAMAMGSAVVAVSQGSASLLWNPAGLSRMSCTEVGLHHNSGLGGMIQEIAVIGMPLGHVEDQEKGEGKGGSLGGIAASLGYVNYGTFDGRDESGLPSKDYRAGEYSGSVGWGMEVLPKFSIGIALKANQSSLAGKTFNAYTTDVGVLWRAMHKVDLGLSYTNINLGSKIGGSQLASGLRLGAAWNANKHVILGISGELQDGGMDRFQLGAEYIIGDPVKNDNVLALRAGYTVNNPDPQLSGLAGLSVGLGYTIQRNVALDYAILPAGELGASHRLSLTFKFACPDKPEPPVAARAFTDDTAEREAAARRAAMAALAAQPVVAAPIVLKAILLEDSHFDYDKSVLRPEGMQALRENIQLLKDNPKAKVRVAGYTSASGSEEYNQLLSERRAAAVEAFLIEEGGIAPGRITTIGFGETRPATFEANPTQTHTAAAKSNMRVLFEVTVK